MGRWFGCQEVLYAEALPLEEVAFDFRLEPDSHLSFVFGDPDEGSHGLRISASERFGHAVFRASPEGEFLSKSALTEAEVGAVQPGNWQHLRVRFAPGGFEAELDGRSIGSFEAALPARHRFGFRNGAGSVRIDEVVVRVRGEDEPRVESFVDSSSLRHKPGGRNAARDRPERGPLQPGSIAVLAHHDGAVRRPRHRAEHRGRDLLRRRSRLPLAAVRPPRRVGRVRLAHGGGAQDHQEPARVVRGRRPGRRDAGAGGRRLPDLGLGCFPQAAHLGARSRADPERARRSRAVLPGGERWRFRAVHELVVRALPRRLGSSWNPSS